jgi:molybdenum cofactor cytidylyltransferase
MIVDLYILAAGMSTRMGQPKPLVQLGATSLLERTVRAGAGSKVRSVTVVTGSCREEVGLLASNLGTRTIWNERYRDGLASSIAASVRDAERSEDPADGLILAGCDQPFLTAGLLDRMISSGQDSPESAVVCEYGDTIGTPAMFPPGWWPELLELQGDRGAKTVLGRWPDRTVGIGWEAGRININTPADLDRIDPASLPDPGNPIMTV